MQIRDAFKTATNALRHAKTRSMLTMLGIVIGIGSVILLMSLGQSAQDYIVNQVKSNGSNLVFIIPGSDKGSRFSAPASAQGIIIKTLTEQDVTALKKEPAIVKVAPEVRGQARVIFGNNDMNVTYDGTTGDFFSMRNYDTAKGFAFTDDDVNSFNHVIVLGSKLAETLFGNFDPIGKDVRVRDLSFRVIGVLVPKGLGPGGIDQDNVALIPISVAQKQLAGIDYYNMITVQAGDTYNIDFVTSRITSVLRQNHHITDPNKDDFTVRSEEEALSILGNVTSVLTIFLTSIACISLVVGGIGIMNIMLVSVTERTKEIGLRKAVGATNGDILQQFLLEAVILTILGAIVGIILGVSLTYFTYLALVKFLSSSWTFSLPLVSIFLAVGVASVIGIIFGIFPARQASRKNPIEALRYE